MKEKKIITYNVNGIRAAIRKGFSEWLAENDYDIVCIQETKSQPDQVPVEEFQNLGYHANWHSAEKKGYSGVLTLSKEAPDQVVEGCGISKYDSEGRIIRTDWGDFSLLNCYFPSGTSGETRQAFKYDFLDDFMSWIENLRKSRKKLLIVGDYNIAHTEIDIHDPKGNKKSSGFLPEEREWMSSFLGNGYVDAFRHLNPEMVEYSWWSYRANARANNKGWRIDYQSVTDNLKENLMECRQLNDVMHSDHCPVYLKMSL